MKIRSGFYLTVLCCLLAPTITMATPEKTVTLNRIVAFVNEDVITEAELSHRVELLQKQLSAQDVALPEPKQFRQQILDQWIDTLLQLQIARNAHITVSETELKKTIDQLAQKNQVSRETLYTKAQQDGWTRSEFEREIQQSLILQKLHEKAVASKIQVKEAEVDNWIRLHKNSADQIKYQLIDIVVPLPEKPSEKVLAEANQQATNIKKALETQSSLNHQLSTPSDPAIESHDLGLRTLRDLPETFAEQVPSMQVNEVRGPMQLPNGLHLIQLRDIQGSPGIQQEEQVELQMIFLTHAEKKDLKRAERVHQALNRGQSFEALVKQYPDDSSLTQRGGYVGWKSLAEIDATLRPAVAQLPVGKISELIATPKGWYIVKILAKKQSPLSEPKEREWARQSLFQEKMVSGIQSFVRDLRNQAYIQIE